MATSDPLPPVAEHDGLFRVTGGAYRQWAVWAPDYSWLVRAAGGGEDGPWRASVTADTLSPAEAYRLAEHVTRAAAYCEAREGEGKGAA